MTTEQIVNLMAALNLLEEFDADVEISDGQMIISIKVDESFTDNLLKGPVAQLAEATDSKPVK